MRIIVTGASGTIGRVLIKCLSKKYKVIGVDKKHAPGVIKMNILKDLLKLRRLFKGAGAIIHLARTHKEAGGALKPILSENKRMCEIILEVALEMKVPKVILASSVHAALGHINYIHPEIVKNHRTLHRKRKVKISDGFFPTGGYGASKIYMEALGMAYSTRGIRVVAVRFGNVRRDNSYGEYPFWLSHRDLCQFIEKSIETKDLPPFSTFFAISENACNPFDIRDASKHLKYRPEDGCPCPLRTLNRPH